MSGALCRGDQLDPKGFERALDLPDGVDCHPCVAGGGRNVTMAKQILDHVNVDTLFQEMGGEAVPQCVTGTLDRGRQHRRHHERRVAAGAS